MKLFHSIRAKLTLWYTMIFVLTLVGSEIVAYLITRSTLIDNLDYSLRNEVKWVNEFIEPKAKKIRLKRAAIKELQELKRSRAAQSDQASVPSGEDREALSDTTDKDRQVIDEMWNQIYHHTLLSPRRHYIQILDRNGDLLFRSQSLRGHDISYPDIPYQWINVVNTDGFDGEHLRLALIQNDYVKIFVAYPLEPVYEVLDNIFYIALIISPFALIISIIGGWFLASKSLKPVDVLTKTAREITVQNLNRRLPTHSVDDEIGRLTTQFNDMIGRLQESFRQMQQFSADASHELRTPLTIMRGEIEVALRNQRLATSSRELLSSIHDELIRLSMIVESLMMLVKSDAGRMVFSNDILNLDELIRQLVEDTSVLAKSSKIGLNFESDSPVKIYGDVARLKQLFLNLIDNAIKYTQAHGKITITLRRDEKHVLISIRDDGIGIPKKDQERIFERFYRVNNSISQNESSGSGLGLPIAKWIAEAHNGTIEVKSREGKGSTFIVRLPIARETEE